MMSDGKFHLSMIDDLELPLPWSTEKGGGLPRKEIHYPLNYDPDGGMWGAFYQDPTPVCKTLASGKAYFCDETSDGTHWLFYQTIANLTQIVKEREPGAILSQIYTSTDYNHPTRPTRQRDACVIFVSYDKTLETVTAEPYFRKKEVAEEFSGMSYWDAKK